MYIEHPKPAGLYIHIPFCIKKCSYCDFYSITDKSLKPAFIDAIKKEISLIPHDFLTYDSIYLGGGTPSLFNTDAIGYVLEHIRTTCSIAPDMEITIEVNPGTVTQKRLSGYKNLGINRLNIGIQTFSESALKLLGRIHTGLDAYAAFDWGRKAGFENIGLDLIYGIPGQTRKQWLKDLQKAVDLNPEHISCYMLTNEPKTPLTKKMQKGIIFPLDDNTISDFFLATISYLKEKGFSQYEISNFSRSEPNSPSKYRSCHNQKYWSFSPYIGVGPSAHSFLGKIRYWNHTSMEIYISAISSNRLPIEQKEILSDEQLIMEAIYLGLRRTDGIDLIEFKKQFDIDFTFFLKSVLKQLYDEEFLRISPTHIALTAKGMLYLDSIASMLIQKLDELSLQP